MYYAAQPVSKDDTEMFPLYMIITAITDFNHTDLHLEKRGRKG